MRALVRAPSDRPKALGRTLAAYAAMVLVPILVLGVVTAADYRSAARRRGVAEGRSEAIVVAQTAVEPILNGRPLSLGLTAIERADMRRLVATAVGEQMSSASACVTWPATSCSPTTARGSRTSPRTRPSTPPTARSWRRLTHLNSDSNDTGEVGPQSVEVYVPLTAGTPSTGSGCSRSTCLMRRSMPMCRPSSAGSTSTSRWAWRLLYLVLSVITFSVSRGLRRQAKWNAYLAEHDTLTDLPNRALFHHRAATALAAVPAGSPIAHRHHRPRPVQGGERHARPPKRRPPAHRTGPPPGRRDASRGHRRPSRWRRVRGHPHATWRTPRGPCAGSEA